MKTLEELIKESNFDDYYKVRELNLIKFRKSILKDVGEALDILNKATSKNFREAIEQYAKALQKGF